MPGGALDFEDEAFNLTDEVPAFTGRGGHSRGGDRQVKQRENTNKRNNFREEESLVAGDGAGGLSVGKSLG